MFKYIAVSLLTIAFLFGFLLQVGAFSVERSNPSDPSTAYPAVTGVTDDAIYNEWKTKDDAAVYKGALLDYLEETISTTSISGFWQ